MLYVIEFWCNFDDSAFDDGRVDEENLAVVQFANLLYLMFIGISPAIPCNIVIDVESLQGCAHRMKLFCDFCIAADSSNLS